MIVRAVDDLNVKVIEQRSPMVGKFILLPNSVRKDIPFTLDFEREMKISPRMFSGKDLGQ